MENLDPVAWIVIGFLAGWISGAIVERGGPSGCLADICVGIIGGLLGGWFATQQMHWHAPTSFLGALVVASLGATVVRLILDAMGGRQRGSD
jgi:uncharacterized membrane protein YeaQ/YmgE (transglycosylase-associated protein family)